MIGQKTWLLGAGLMFSNYLYRKLKVSSHQKPLKQFQYNMVETSNKIVQDIMICQKKKKMAARDWVFFFFYPIYLYRKL